MAKPKDWTNTNNGIAFFPLNPKEQDISIEDIAEGLSKECRYNGQCDGMYSVAEHSVIVSHLVPPHLALAALLHDGSEAYLKDIPRPIKMQPAFASYLKVEKVLQDMIYRKFGCDWPDSHMQELYDIDHAMIHVEVPQIFKHINPAWRLKKVNFTFIVNRWERKQAKRQFLKRFKELKGSNYAYQRTLMDDVITDIPNDNVTRLARSK